MKLIRQKINTVAPGGDYAFGRTRDDDGSNNGTPANFDSFNDYFEFFDYLMFIASIPNTEGGPVIIANGQYDNDLNGYQIPQALEKAVRVFAASKTLRGTARLATQAEVNTGTNDLTIVTPLTAKTLIDALVAIETARAEAAEAAILGAWTLRSDVTDISIVGGTAICTSSHLKYRVQAKTMHLLYSFVVTNTNHPSEFSILIPASKSNNVGFTVTTPVNIFNGGTQILGIAELATGTPTGIRIAPDSALTDGQATIVSGQLTFEIA